MLRVVVDLVQRRLAGAYVQPAEGIVHTGNLYLHAVAGLEDVRLGRQADAVLVNLARLTRLVLQMGVPLPLFREQREHLL